MYTKIQQWLLDSFQSVVFSQSLSQVKNCCLDFSKERKENHKHFFVQLQPRKQIIKVHLCPLKNCSQVCVWCYMEICPTPTSHPAKKWFFLQQTKFILFGSWMCGVGVQKTTTFLPRWTTVSTTPQKNSLYLTQYFTFFYNATDFFTFIIVLFFLTLFFVSRLSLEKRSFYRFFKSISL